MKIVIAIDGFSSSGKSTMAKQLAHRLNYRYIDSGAMYRAVALYALRHDLVNDIPQLIKSLPDIKIDFALNPDGSQSTMLNGENVEKEIRTMAVSSCVSPLAAVPEIRRALVKAQQEFGREKGIVMDGRDIGTVVFPDAELKIFVNASPETRAKRRLEELRAKGDTTSTFEDVLQNIKDRDYRDTHRADSPMHITDDTIVLDNSDMTLDEQNAALDAIVKQCLDRLKA